MLPKTKFSWTIISSRNHKCKKLVEQLYHQETTTVKHRNNFQLSILLLVSIVHMSNLT